jgi:serine/threonine protein kinase
VNTQEFQRIERVFHAALKLGPEERTPFITGELPDEPALQQEVGALLAAAQRGSTFMETSLLTGPFEPPDIDALVGREIGAYRLVRVLGRGGMGTVYEAEQKWPHRRVALKVIHGAPGADAARWSGHEPKILGRLNHPFVASIYDADRTEDGLSYFVMELIDGQRLDEYVKEHDVSRRERLLLFCKVCEAIQHAHMKSVIHLDLKPSNILVIAPKDPSCQDLQVKVVDFGVAAITGSDTTHTTRLGATGGMVGTLAYMSPEQRRGERETCDVRSDVYSLGVVLFKLMTGELPYPIEGVPPHEAWRTLAEQAPRRARALDPSVPVDVETIIRTATADEATRRYQSVSELAGDVRLYLTDRPITARRPSKVYEWSKFAKRNKGLVGVVLALLLGLTSTTIGTYTGLVRAREAEIHMAEVADTNKKLTALLVGDDPIALAGAGDSSTVYRRNLLEGLRITAQQMVRDGRLEEAEAEYATLIKTARMVLPQQPNWYLARLYGEHGECLMKLGRYAQSELPLLTSYEHLQTLYGDEHSLTLDAIRRLVQLYQAWGKPGQAAEWAGRLLAGSSMTGETPP